MLDIKIISQSKIFTGLTAAVVLFAIFALIYSLETASRSAWLIIGGQKIVVELPITSKDFAKGLGGRKFLAQNRGMLFVYDRYLVPSFWMKDMNFPLDIIWLKDDLVVGWEQNAPAPLAGEPLTIYQPKTFINRVLEVKAGSVELWELKIGDRIESHLTK
jgi:uncharacterized membrane protein (UPF0127 family)